MNQKEKYQQRKEKGTKDKDRDFTIEMSKLPINMQKKKKMQHNNVEIMIHCVSSAPII